jgi:hypothetical protein
LSGLRRPQQSVILISVKDGQNNFGVEKGLSSSNAAILEALLASSLESQQHFLRIIAVQYAGVLRWNIPFHPRHSSLSPFLATGDP